MATPSSRLVLFLALLGTTWNWAATARADLIFYTKGGGFSSQLQSLGIQDFNVLFNLGGSANGPALTVTGVTNQLNLLVDVSSSENLTGQGGQAPAVQGQDGSFSSASVAFNDPNLLIHSLFFNLSNINGVTESTVRFTVTDQFSQTTFTEVVNNGNNFFAVIAFNGQLLRSGSIQVLDSSSGSVDVLDQLSQIRISAVAADTGLPVNTPEPSSWFIWLGAAGCVTLIALRRWALKPQTA